MLKVENLSVCYGNIKVLHGISLIVKEGEIVALLGANGAGKSTTLMSIMRFQPPEGPRVVNGSISYKSADLLSCQTHEIVSAHRISLVPEGKRIFGNLSVLENLKLATYARKDHDKIKKDYDQTFSLFPRLLDRQNQLADTLSGGEQQMLAVGRALMSSAEFIMFDEPSMGLAPVLMQELFRVLKQLNEKGVTILIVEQNVHIALKYAHRAYVMETGRIVLEGNANDLVENPEVKKAYLG
ncbi:MAG: ABC transporter ATP-binding protein [Pseudomonadota bacterium]